MTIYFSTTKDDAEDKAKNGFMEKGLVFTTDKSYAKQTAKKKTPNPVVVAITGMNENAFERTRAKKETYKNIVRFLTAFTVEEL